MFENTIYDPNSNFVVNGVTYRNPFPNNTIPARQLDPVALKIQTSFRFRTNAGLINNYLPTYANPRVSTIPSVKIDYLLGPKSKLSGYWSLTATNTPNNGRSARPDHLGARRDIIPTNTARLNFDQTLTPTLLLHVGVGLLDMHFFQSGAASIRVSRFGLTEPTQIISRSSEG